MDKRIEQIDIEKIKTRTPFEGLFRIDDKIVEAIAKSMDLNGYDATQPITVWMTSNGDNPESHLYVVDGHTRLQAAKKAEISEIFVTKKAFPDEDAAFEYAVSRQRDRRNTSDADRFHCILAVDKRKRSGERSDLAQDGAKSGKSADITAKIVGVSTRKVEKVRTISDHGDAELIAAVKSNKKSINKAYTEIRKQKKQKETTNDSSEEADKASKKNSSSTSDTKAAESTETTDADQSDNSNVKDYTSENKSGACHCGENCKRDPRSITFLEFEGILDTVIKSLRNDEEIPNDSQDKEPLVNRLHCKVAIVDRYLSMILKRTPSIK